MKKTIAISITAFSIFFGAIAALGADKYILPVLQYQHIEVTQRLLNIEGVIRMQELYNKKVQLHKLNQEIRQTDNPADGLIEYKKYLEQEIDLLLQPGQINLES